MSESDDWGIFPKMTQLVFNTLKERGSKFILYLSAVEFYLMQAYDLLDKSKQLCVRNSFGIMGQTQIEIANMEDLTNAL